jgi:chromosome segregation ATPase
LGEELNTRDEKQKEVYEDLSKEQTKVSEQSHTIDQLRKDNETLKKTCADLKSRLPPEEDADGEHSPSKFEDLEREHRELKKSSREKDVLIKKFELDLESMKEEKDRFSSEYQQVFAKSMEDSETIKRLESAKAMLQTKLEAALEDGKDAMEMKTTMQSKIDELSMKLKETEQLLQDAHSRVVEAESDARMTAEKMERVERDFETRNESYYAPMDAENARLREDRRLMLEKIGLMETDLAERTTLMDEMEDALRQVRAENDQLKNRVQIAGDMEEIKMKEFEKLMSTNLHVASTIEKMMGHMRQKKQSGEEQEGDDVAYD